MNAIYFFYGLAFEGLGLAAYLQIRRNVKLPLRNEMPWLAAFGFAAGATGWVDMFLIGDISAEVQDGLTILRMILQPVTGLLLLIFGYRILTRLTSLPSWVIFIPGVLIIPITFVIAYAFTTFITPSPIEIPIDIWSRYLLYLPGSIMAGIGFLRQWKQQGQAGYADVANLMLGAGMAFLLEAFVVGLVVPAAPYGPASYYNYNRVVENAFTGENMGVTGPYGLSAWLDYNHVLEVTGFPIQFWRMISAFLVTFFVTRGLNVFDATLRRQLEALQAERDRANKAAFEAQENARISAENWTTALVNIGRRISELDDVDNILLFIVENSRQLLGADFTGLALVNGEFTRLELKCFSTLEKTDIVHAHTLVNHPFILEAIRSPGASRLADDQTGHLLEGISFFCDEAARAMAVTGLQIDTTPIGAFWVARFEHRPYSETDLIWLESLADQIDIAIKHGVMTSQLQSLSIAEERSRIAREMHDSLAQILGYLNLELQALEVKNQQGKTEAVQESLRKMRAEVRTAHADVRANILSLRTTLANEKGLVASIQEYLKEFGYQTGIKTRFNNKACDDLSLPAIAEIQLVCILNEALANVRKHAHSQHVVVSLIKTGEPGNETVQLTIEDDGIGFVATDQKLHFGLATMRERAKSAGGELTIHSVPGEGTRIECCLPCMRNENLFQQGLRVQSELL